MKKDFKIFIIDDEEGYCQILSAILRKEGYTVRYTTQPKEALNKLKAEKFHLLISDLKMPEISGLDLLQQALQIEPDLQVIMITAYGSVESAVDAMKQGAYDYLLKPFQKEEIKLIVHKAFERVSLMEELNYLHNELDQKYNFENLIGKSKALREIIDFIKRIAPARSTVLIEGESGTGKELVARAIHQHSKRKDKKFVAINCSAFQETILESELFGHKKGSFTGAYIDKKGIFSEADSGTILLDEISETSISFQARLLRVLQEQEFLPVGSTSPIKVDLRVIASTNQNLEQLVQSGNFRKDLYYRLNVVHIQLPPLRERLEDIPLLVDFFLHKYGELNNRPNIKISLEVLRIFMNYSWQGNIRELENVIESAIVMSKTDEIQPNDLSIQIMPTYQSQIDYTLKENLPLLPLNEFKKLMEKDYIIQVLKHTKGNISKAARIAGIHRTHFHQKIKSYNINPKDFNDSNM